MICGSLGADSAGARLPAAVGAAVAVVVVLLLLLLLFFLRGSFLLP